MFIKLKVYRNNLQRYKNNGFVPFSLVNILFLHCQSVAFAAASTSSAAYSRAEGGLSGVSRPYTAAFGLVWG